tara:strand:+ start:1497 stop:2450 length:954 start_codon:yes stop_codon:yes gene_type:complete
MGFLDFLFGGEEETPNPMRQWGIQGPQATWNYYESAIADSRRVMRDYWSIWTQQMDAVKNMYSGSMDSIESNYNAARANIALQRSDYNDWERQQRQDLNRQRDKQIKDIRDQEKTGAANLTRKSYASGLIGSTAAKQWQAGLEDRANEAVAEVEENRANMANDLSARRVQAERGFTAAEADLAARRAAMEQASMQSQMSSLIDVLGRAPIAADPGIDLKLAQAQGFYGTPWESYTNPIVTETPGLITDTLLPAATGGLVGGFTGGFGSAFGSGFGDQASSWFGNLFGGSGVSVNPMAGTVTGGGGTFNLGNLLNPMG